MGARPPVSLVSTTCVCYGVEVPAGRVLQVRAMPLIEVSGLTKTFRTARKEPGLGGVDDEPAAGHQHVAHRADGIIAQDLHRVALDAGGLREHGDLERLGAERGDLHDGSEEALADLRNVRVGDCVDGSLSSLGRRTIGCTDVDGTVVFDRNTDPIFLEIDQHTDSHRLTVSRGVHDRFLNNTIERGFDLFVQLRPFDTLDLQRDVNMMRSTDVVEKSLQGGDHPDIVEHGWPEAT